MFTQLNNNRREKNTWLESSPWIRHAISVLWHTLMQVKQQLPSVFFSIQDVFIRLVKHMKVLHKWTGWSRSRNVESRLPLQQQQLSGITTVLTLLIHQDTLILL